MLLQLLAAAEGGETLVAASPHLVLGGRAAAMRLVLAARLAVPEDGPGGRRLLLGPALAHGEHRLVQVGGGRRADEGGLDEGGVGGVFGLEALVLGDVRLPQRLLEPLRHGAHLVVVVVDVDGVRRQDSRVPLDRWRRGGGSGRSLGVRWRRGRGAGRLAPAGVLGSVDGSRGIRGASLPFAFTSGFGVGAAPKRLTPLRRRRHRLPALQPHLLHLHLLLPRRLGARRLLLAQAAQLVALRRGDVVAPLVVVGVGQVGEEAVALGEVAAGLQRLVDPQVIPQALRRGEALGAARVVAEVLQRLAVQLHVVQVVRQELDLPGGGTPAGRGREQRNGNKSMRRIASGMSEEYL